MTLNDFALYSYDAVWSVALAMVQAEDRIPGWLEDEEELEEGFRVHLHGVEFSNLIRTQTFRGATGNLQFTRQVGTQHRDAWVGNFGCWVF